MANGTTTMPPPGQFTFVTFGSNANCTLELCSVEWSALGYRPSLAANFTFIGLFALAALAHLYLGVRTRSWSFMAAMVSGCIICIVGYAGRIMVYHNPWSFVGFMLQIVLVGSGPVWFCAAIYVTLSKTVMFLDPACSRIRPALYVPVFLSCDFIALVLQAAGGALSTTTRGESQAGVNMGLAGLSFQVATMTVFSACLVDYLARYRRSGGGAARARLADGRLRLFLAALAAATVLILARSAYRVEELSGGYSGPSIRNEPMFIGLEGVLIIVAVFLLCIGHPGLGLRHRAADAENVATGSGTDSGSVEKAT